MKLLVDLFPCQTNSRFRGIGRYTLSLFREMVNLRGTNEIVALVNSLYPEAMEDLRREFNSKLQPGSFLPYYQPDHNGYEGDLATHEEVSSVLIRQAYQTVKPDVILYPSLFENGEVGTVALPDGDFPSGMRTAIFYDLIPYIFHEEYLDHSPALKKDYLRRLNVLKNFGLLLSISEATRQDAINLLGFDANKIVNISGGVSPQFKRLEITEDEKSKLLIKFGITRPFVLYIGGFNPRKNMEGTVQAYAQLPAEILKTHQLVMNYVGDQAAFYQRVKKLGLSPQDVIITGRVSDYELVCLYNLCKLFIFPSFYEGFGLPILEAMACGAPVIAANNSSLPEVMGRSDALFDAKKNDSITEAIQRVLNDDSLRQDLSCFGLERVKQFTWENSARIAWDAIQDRLEKRAPAVAQVQQRSKRVAYISPLPPQKSGIANYSADLLPYLQSRFDIDLFTDADIQTIDSKLKDSFDIYSWKKLPEMYKNYETVIYHIGNSPFHEYMLKLLPDYPGVVVLHDFYLSHLVRHINPENIRREFNKQHGLKGVLDFVELGAEKALLNWPLNLDILKNAQEIIVHSKYHQSLIQRYYRYGWKPSLNVINLFRICKPENANTNINEIKSKFRLDPQTMVFSSFGFLTPQKYNADLITAFSKALPNLGDNVKLVFAGECISQEYREELNKLIKQHNLGDKVLITGYLSNEEYESYLAISDIAIQLRKDSRGETSAAALDCLAYGIPTIVNAHATNNDLDENAALIIPDQFTIDELSDALIQLATNETLRAEKSKQAVRLIQEEHHPEKIASQYADVIHRAMNTSKQKLFEPLIRKLIQTGAGEGEIHRLAKLAAKNDQLKHQNRLLIDVTVIAISDGRTGIQRVVRSIIKELAASEDRSIVIQLVRVQEQTLCSANRYAEVLFNLPPNSLGSDEIIKFQPADTLLMLDSSWPFIDNFIPSFNEVKRLGGRIVSVVYDLIPIRYPQYIVDNNFFKIFDHWLPTALKHSDKMICISQAVAEDLKAYIAENHIPVSDYLEITHFHLGADIVAEPAERKIRESVDNLVKDQNSPLFIMVGTVEPRKNHGFVLDAFERLWQEDSPARLCILGKIGWKVDSIEKRIRIHPELGKRLAFIENPTDAEINLCYQSATGLIAASIAEGFGLPIVEAALHQVPVVVSDIPVFREVGGEGALFFSLQSPDCLAEAVKAMSSMNAEARAALASKVKVLTWKESAAWFFDEVRNQRSSPETVLSY